MSAYTSNRTNTQNELLLTNLMNFYKNKENLNRMMKIVNGESRISLRIVDWFVTNYAKKYYTLYSLQIKDEPVRFKVYNDYKLKLKAYSKKRFDPFCRWERISVPCDENDDDKQIETTIGQLNFFKWAIECNILNYIEENFSAIEKDMNQRNSTSKRKQLSLKSDCTDSSCESAESCGEKTRKKREELSVSACKCIKKEMVKIVVKFN